jgi:hydrogenase/urease accessory protein HupE
MGEARSPVRKARSPVRKARSAVRKVRSAVRKVRSPTRGARSPQRKARSPVREARPALVQITQRDAHHFDVLWKQPVNGDVALHLAPQLSGGALERDPDVNTITPSYALRQWRKLADSESQPLKGQTLSVAGLDRSITDVLVSVTLLNGRTTQQILTPRQPQVTLDFNAHAAPAAAAYLKLGIEHILTGVDHLLFVFGLLLLVRKPKPLLGTITAFTAAHSTTLAATALGWIQVRSSVVEALVALSIVILAVELARHAFGKAGVTTRYPWLIAFAFGLLHGCAFAGALAEVGLPSQAIPLALFLFNVGVEIGQLLFIAAAWLALAGVKRLMREPQPWTRLIAPYAIGSFAAYWFIERFLLAISLNGIPGT